ncbi:hypothetical protein [Brevundimonas sp. Root1279]|uniref:hypothetical protein n=1 Tax=Brevundimonas sp. Root1279 TaxID=1736443 RepID=UPI0012E337E5|nr:hypothetical protein [Brevundimonas sp. Root1279]
MSSILQLLGAHGDPGVLARIDKLDADLAAGELGALNTVLAETTGSMGSLRDQVLLAADGRTLSADANDRLFGLVGSAADQCREAMRHHGMHVWR